MKLTFAKSTTLEMYYSDPNSEPEKETFWEGERYDVTINNFNDNGTVHITLEDESFALWVPLTTFKETITPDDVVPNTEH